MKKEMLLLIQYIGAMFILLVASGLAISGFIVDPTGQIHNSVISVIGVLLTFVGGVFGIGSVMDSWKFKSANTFNSKMNEYKNELIEEARNEARKEIQKNKEKQQ